ncbi:MAG: hypothetical protein DMG14_13985 [Acidobacteria bacterium]|nr:MAG: hypothetical protein DMG14_13985 [Acidobacteriota bacterium]
MMDFLAWLEQSGFATWARESNSLFAYPSILFLHTVGMGLVAGISALIDLRILGCADEIPLTGMQRLLPYMWAGFWLNTATGIVLFILDATTKAINPVFYTKMGFIAMAVVLCVIQGRGFRDPLVDKRPVDVNGKIIAFASIMCWMAAITAGRLLAYLGPGVISNIRH